MSEEWQAPRCMLHEAHKVELRVSPPSSANSAIGFATTLAL